MSVDVGVDVGLLKSEIKKTYASVSQEPEKDFIFPTGRAWAEDLGYPDELSQVPDLVAESFAGVANPWVLGGLEPGERVLDIGSGAGMDSLIAALMVGPEGSVTGIDMTPEMIENARKGAAELGLNNVTFVEGEAETLPFDDSSFDVVISNGVIDLIPDKDAVFGEIYRVLVPAGESRSPTSRSSSPCQRRAVARSISGPAELPELCWTQSTQRCLRSTVSSESSTATS